MMDSTMAARRWLWVALCALALLGCGGSGSSGFDATAAENAAIDRALESSGCVAERGLTICASGSVETPATPPASPTATAFPDATGTPTGTPPRSSPTPTPTRTPPTSQPGVDIQPDPTDVANCVEAGDSQSCGLRLVFVPVAAPADAAYRAAVRQRDPDGPWQILPVSGNVVEIVIGPDVAVVQTAILLYERDPGTVPNEVELLADSGADFAFVTAPLVVRASGSP
jgi:hypothetical protein